MLGKIFFFRMVIVSFMLFLLRCILFFVSHCELGNSKPISIM